MFTGNVKKFMAILCATLIIMPLFSVYASANDDEDENRAVRPSGMIYADFLKNLGFFYGTDKGFKLEKKLNRDEAAVVIVRLMGAESKALAGTYDMPFTDVDSWARPYVGWMYENNITSGVGEGKFGSKNPVTAQQYLTFLVRCLGYSDAEGDFTYEGVFDFAVEKGLFREEFEVGLYRYHYPDFLRFDCTELTFYALTWKMKSSEKALADRLMENGVFTEDTFIEGLRTFAMIHGVNEDGKIIWKYWNKAELPWLGISEETYTTTGWEFDDYIIAFAGSGQASSYAVDSKTLERKSKISEHQIALVDWNLYNGLLYFYEYEAAGLEGSPVAIKTYDWTKDEVKLLLRCEAPVACYEYGDYGGDRSVLIAGKTGGKYEYSVVQLSTGTVKNCLSEEAESMAAQGVDFRTGRVGILVRLIFDDEIRYDIYEADLLRDSILMPKKAGFDHEGQIGILTNEKGGKITNLVFDQGMIIKIGDDKKMTWFADFEKGVISAFAAQDENVYVLTGKEWYGEELGVVSADGAYTVLSPESVIKSLGVIKITDVSQNGDVTFVSENDQGMMHMDVTTYVYEASSKKVKVVSFVPGRGEFYTPESIKERLEEIQKKLDELRNC